MNQRELGRGPRLRVGADGAVVGRPGVRLIERRELGRIQKSEPAPPTAPAKRTDGEVPTALQVGMRRAQSFTPHLNSTRRVLGSMSVGKRVHFDLDGVRHCGKVVSYGKAGARVLAKSEGEIAEFQVRYADLQDGWSGMKKSGEPTA